MSGLMIMVVLALNNTLAAPGPQITPTVASVSLSEKVYSISDIKLPECKPVDIEFSNEADRCA